MSNFEFLKEKTEYALFASAAIEAERVYVSAPAMCAVGSRKALELAVKWVYSADTTMQLPYKDNLQALIHEPTFRFAVDYNTWGKLPFIVKLGNMAVHTERSVQASDALAALQGLFEFIQWLDYCYGSDYEERQFEEAKIPTERVVVDTKKIKEQESLLGEKDAEIEALRKKIEQMADQITASKDQHRQDRTFVAADLSEFKTRNKRMRKLEATTERKEMPKMLARGFRVEARVGGTWKTVFEDAENWRRLRRIAFDPVEADALRVVVTATWGGDKAHVFALDAL